MTQVFPAMIVGQMQQLSMLDALPGLAGPRGVAGSYSPSDTCSCHPNSSCCAGPQGVPEAGGMRALWGLKAFSRG